MEKSDQQTLIDDLQARVSFQEDLLTTLNQQVAEQNRELTDMAKQLKLLYKKVEALSFDLEQARGGDEAPPPHY